MLEAAEADLALEAGFVHVKARLFALTSLAANFRECLARVSGFGDGGVGPVARCQTHQLHPSCGTE
jgi:hypothetical protein